MLLVAPTWTASEPLLGPPPGFCAIKDPSIVKHEGVWHLFVTLRGEDRAAPSHAIEHIQLKALKGPVLSRARLSLGPGPVCAPQILYFRPKRRWFLIFQGADANGAFGPRWSAAESIEGPWSWPRPLYAQRPAGLDRLWLDFWVIADAERSFLFFTACNGNLWRAATSNALFPEGFGEPQLALRDDLFEAGHIFGLPQGGYLAMIEARARPFGRRYFKAYRAERLDGAWREGPSPFASPKNVRGARWTRCFSHGELLRASPDERALIDPARCGLLFQGVAPLDRLMRPYARRRWRLGLLSLSSET